VTCPDGPRTGRPTTRAGRGLVATSHVLASGAGLVALRRGGSAVDAAIAANAVLCVAYPHMAGLGGDAFFLVKPPGEQVTALNASGPAAAQATRDWYAEQGHPEEIPSRGGLAALTVPGAVDGWRQAHERWGRLPWRELFDDAVRYARDGVPVARSLAQWSAQDVPVLSQQDEAARLYLRDGRGLREGERLTNPGLAASFETIARDGGRAFYEGPLAQRLCAALEPLGSPLTADDLAAFRAEEVEPIRTNYRGLEVFEFPPNTQGFAALQILNLLEGFDVRALGDLTSDYLHVAAESVKLAFADRDAWLTDPRSLDIPLARLLSKEYADERRGKIGLETSLPMGEIPSGVEGAPAGGSAGSGGDTCYLCAVDDDGMAVSLIQSVFHDFGAGVVARDTGIIPQNRGSFFSLADDHPNRLEPGKRTFHTLIPAMATRDGDPYLVFGTMGGEGQPQTHAAMLTRLVDFGYDVQQAIEAPRWLMGRTWGAESQDLWLEGRIGEPVVRELERRGQPVKMLPSWDDNCGHAQAIRFADDGFLEGGADPRGDGAALGF
jgi:gamma-glutamyltranspeptidase